MKVVISEAAFGDLNDIHDYIATDAPTIAQRQVLSILSMVHKLRLFPSLGRPGRVDGTRELIVHKHYIAVYRVRPQLDIIEVIAIAHAARDR